METFDIDLDLDMKNSKRPPKTGTKERKKADFEAALTFLQHLLLCPAVAACAALPEGPFWTLLPEFVGVLIVITVADFFFGGYIPKKYRPFVKTVLCIALYFVLMLVSAVALKTAIYAAVLAAFGSAAIYAANRRCASVGNYPLESQICARFICAAITALAISRAVIKL